MKKHLFLFLWMALCTAFAGTLHAQMLQPDYFGLKMKSESYLEDLTWDELRNVPHTIGVHEGIDRQVYAFARYQSAKGPAGTLKVDVYNGSKDSISAKQLLTHFWVITRDGRRLRLQDYSRSIWGSNQESIPPKGSRSFSPSFSGLDLRHEDISYLICSFDLDDTKIVLIPMPRQTKPAVIKEKVSLPVKKVVQKDLVKPKPKPSVLASAKPATQSATKPTATQTEKAKKKTGTLFNFFPGNKKKAETVDASKKSAQKSIQKTVSTKTPKPKAASKTNFGPKKDPVIPAAKIPAKKAAAPKPAAAKKVASVPKSKPEPPKSEWVRIKNEQPIYGQYVLNRYKAIATVLEMNSVYQFVVVDAGHRDGLRKNQVINIVRDEQIIAKAIVDDQEPYVSGAKLVPEYTVVKPEPGDKISRHVL